MDMTRESVADIKHEATVELVVVGAHLSGMPLNRDLIDLGARLVAATRTAPVYRLYELAGAAPRKPGLLRVSGDGASVEVEVWSLGVNAFGAFVAAIPPPLGIGTVMLADGQGAKGFLVEAVATETARDITSFGGWRNFVSRDSAA
jgi:allophanate hydrolase